jgi:endonuclease III
MIEEEWECPVGLTADHAICVDNSSSEDDDHVICHDNDDHQVDEIDVGAINRTNSISSSFKNISPPGQEVITAKECAQKIISGPMSGDNKSNVNSLSDKNDYTNNKPEPSPSQKSENTCNKNDNDSNPFADFAFKGDEASSSISSTSWQSKKRTSQIPTTSLTSQKKKVKQVKESKKQDNTKKSWSITELQVQSTKTEGDEHLDKEEHRQELIKKWHSFSDSNAPIEERRFQVLIAARIHARCQEPIVYKAMQRLREYFARKETIDGSSCSLSAKCLAQCDHASDIAPLLSSVLFGNVKAQHIVQAAHDVLSKFRGQVPESMTSLQDITGIGPKLSQILNIVNRRDTYTSQK